MVSRKDFIYILNILSVLSCKPKLKVIMFCCQQKCIGAIDGTHISAFVPIEKQVSYKGRKVVVTKNVVYMQFWYDVHIYLCGLGRHCKWFMSFLMQLQDPKTNFHGLKKVNDKTNSVNTSPRGHDLYPTFVVPLKMIKLVKPQNRPNIHDDAPSLPILAPLAFICCSWQWRDYNAEEDEDDDVAIHGCTTLIYCGYIIWKSTREHEQKSRRTIGMLSQLHISILKPSPSWKKSRSLLFFFPFLLFQVIKFFPFPKTSSSSSVSSPKISFISPPAYASSSFLFPSR